MPFASAFCCNLAFLGKGSISHLCVMFCPVACVTDEKCLPLRSGMESRKANQPLSGKEKKRKDYAFRRQFDEKPSITPGCPGATVCYTLQALHSACHTGDTPPMSVSEIAFCSLMPGHPLSW